MKWQLKKCVVDKTASRLNVKLAERRGAEKMRRPHFGRFCRVTIGRKLLTVKDAQSGYHFISPFFNESPV
jgi:hypothetical protein